MRIYELNISKYIRIIYDQHKQSNRLIPIEFLFYF